MSLHEVPSRDDGQPVFYPNSDRPVTVITTGDNIYGRLGFTLRFNDTGDKDIHWDARFFRPFALILTRIPFYPSPRQS